ncbi:MAG: methylated-DNA--[protein]-cysteine S-methyltransferase [Vicingus serpentipes]|nr:methylated-DNA--[protein]-cysteine S-methyltransferase [Vicingus serpentipes]
MEKQTITLSHINTPIGIVTAGLTLKGVAMLKFDTLAISESKQHILNRKSNQLFNQLEKQLNEYFEKKRTTFDIPLDLNGTDFQLNVWKELLNIPYGTTRTYKEQAITLGNIKSIRAVATANGTNPIPIIIPCHRVIGSDGSLTGFSGGLWRKKFLLDLESSQTSLF